MSTSTSMATPASSPAQHELPYAMAAPSYSHKVGAGVAILLAGLGLIVLGGCFLIGVMLISNHGFNQSVASAPLSPHAIVLIFVLYTLAAITLACAAIVLLAGLRALFQVMRG
jgi:hypothetical protein